MKIIINRGFSNYLTDMIVFRNGKEIAHCSLKEDYCFVNPEEGDKISIMLKFPVSLTAGLCTFTYHKGNEVIYIAPTLLAKYWDIINYSILPYLCLVLFALQAVIKSDAYTWICAAIISLTALSIIISKTFMQFPSTRKKLINTHIL